jgi:dihydrofolate reductase
MIWAMGKNREIGINNALPWHLPNDLQHFKQVTSGKTVIMGLSTYYSLGRALPNRRNIVINFTKIDLPGCEVVISIKDALEAVKGEDEAFIIGGASIYQQFLPFAEKLYITLIDQEFKADRFFPEFDMARWKLKSKEKGLKDEKNPFDYHFCVYIHN